MKNTNEMPDWAQKLDRRIDALLEKQKPKKPKEKKPEKDPKPKETDKEIEDWAKTNRDGKIYGY